MSFVDMKNLKDEYNKRKEIEKLFSSYIKEKDRRFNEYMEIMRKNKILRASKEDNKEWYKFAKWEFDNCPEPLRKYMTFNTEEELERYRSEIGNK